MHKPQMVISLDPLGLFPRSWVRRNRKLEPPADYGADIWPLDTHAPWRLLFDMCLLMVAEKRKASTPRAETADSRHDG